VESLHNFAEFQGGRSIGPGAVALFLTCFFFAGSCVEHCAEADPDLTLIVTVDCAIDPGACAVNCIVADPDALV